LAKIVRSQNRFVNGISDFLKEGQPESYSFSRAIDASNPRQIELQPKAIRESGSVIVDLPKWGEQTRTGITYVIGDSGTFYSRSTAGSWSALRTVSGSHGNGLSYFAEDDYVYYTGDKVIGRYGPLSATTPQFADDFLGTQGGVRLNTYSLTLASASSQYGSKTDSATLSITGDLSIEAYINPTSLPATGATQTILGKWDESGATRSYRFDIAGVSASFGSGGDGALTISADTTDTPIDSACTGTSGSQSLSATNASFATGQILLIHQTQGTGAGLWERNEITSYTSGTITLVNALSRTFGTGAQVLVLKQYTNVTINSGKTWIAKAWNGTVGGILGFLCNGTLTVTGSINATGKGFRGGQENPTGNTNGYGGEGQNGGYNEQRNSANGSGAGAASLYGNERAGGGGGGNGSSGNNGGQATPGRGGIAGIGGGVTGNNSLTTLLMGGGGGSGAVESGASAGNAGGNGGGIVYVYANDIATITGTIINNGSNGSGTTSGSAGGAGAGGSVLLKCITAALGTTKVTASGGTGGDGGGTSDGGNGGNGRIHVDYYTSVSGTTTPTLDSTQDNTLSTTTTYQLRLSVSTDGTALETLTRPCSLTTSTWKHVSVTYDASASLATFYLNANSLGTTTGALTAISDNASALYLGAHKGASAVGNFLNAKIDEVRLWNDIRTAGEILQYKDLQITTTSTGLVAYYTLNNAATDGTTNANNLTLSGSPAYSTDTPFLSPTTRQDIDQSHITTGQTYTLATSIGESATEKITFTPTKDPQKSASVLVETVGTGDWTLTVHDSSNVEIVSKTIANASVIVGQLEFVFASVWRPLPNASYHIHVTSTVADGKVTTETTADLSTADYKTYYQFLVEDAEWHPIAKMLQFLVIGNERYIGKYEATLYEPNYITLPSGWRIRTFGYWREYLVIGCMKGTNIYDFDNGRVYFWDGIATTYNFYIDIPEGGVNAVFGTRGNLFVWAGYQGDMLIYSGGDKADKIKRLPKVESTKYLEIYPGAVTMWKSILHFGGGRSNSVTFERGVYSYGAINIRYNESMSFDYVNSGGTYDSDVEVGLVMVVNQKLLMGYRDGISYGIDYVDASNAPATSGTIEGIVQDEGLTWKTKEAMSVVASFLPLNSDETVAVKYKLDRNDTWTSSTVISTVGATQARVLISPTTEARCREYQWAVDLSTSVSTSPQLISVGVEVDTLDSEKTFSE
jgi:hypothetical protein